MSLVIYNYHRVRRSPDEKTAFDDRVFSVTADALASLAKRLKRDTDVLSESDLIEAIENPKRMPRRASAITFDDGYRDNFTVAYPVLKAIGAPAIFFVPTDVIEKRQVGWWDVFAYLVKKAGRPVAEANAHQEAFKTGRGMSPEALSRELGIELPTSEEQSAELLSWEEAQVLARPPFAVGSHTHTHRILSSLDLAEQRFELSVSKRLLEERLAREVRTLAYPVGGYDHFHLETKTIARECGYRLAFSYLTGSNRAKIDPWDVRRHEGPRDLSVKAGARRFLSSLLQSPRALRAPRAISLGPSAR